MHLPVGTQLQGGRYEILCYISSGGFGCTYEARDTKFRSRVKSVAIKEFFVKDFCNRDTVSNSVVVGTQSKKELVEKLRNKFLEEADAIFELEHPNIVRVTDTFEENGTAYYVMEYINGSTLASIIEKEGALSEDKALGYICQIADALCHIHSRNRLHLDVKPGNIMIDQSGKAVLIDFGVSKQYDEVCGENTSTLMGFTPGYAPLEQSNKGIREFSPTTDIYSLGATLYKLVTGQTPPDASDVNEDGLPALPQEISAPVRVAIEAAMQPRRKDRPQSVAEFLKLLENGGKSKDERAESKDETILNSSSTPGGEVSRSDGGESELSKVKTENGKLKTASFDDEETQVDINPPRPSATPPFEKVGELSNGVNDEEETLLNSENGMNDDTLHAESVSVLQIDKPSFKEENEENKSRKSLWIIPLLLLIAGGCAWFLFEGAPSPATGYENGYGYVDLGLSVKWAAYNVGANSPVEYGNLYDWDESQQLATGNRRLPTKGELEELKDKCKWEWTTQNGVNGYKVTGPNGNSIFVPAGGIRSISGNVGGVGILGFYLSSSSGGLEKSWFFHFNSSGRAISIHNHVGGYSVRLVQD